MKQVVLIRHGATAGNLQRRYIGRTDEPLCDLGIQQALALKGAAPRADILFVSPMRRTRQTAELTYPGQAYTVIEDLRETDFGLFEGKTAGELSGDRDYRRWVGERCRTPIPGGEAVAAFKARCTAAFLQAMEQVPDGSSAAFVIHGGCIMAILEALAVPKRDFYAYHLKNGAFLSCICQEDTSILQLQ